LLTLETSSDITTTNVPPRDGVGSYDAAETNHYLIYLHNDYAKFWINDILVANIQIPSSQGGPSSSSSLPIFARVYNSGVASAGRRVEIGFVSATLGDLNAASNTARYYIGTNNHKGSVNDCGLA
jgi:hypothetical protein